MQLQPRDIGRAHYVVIRVADVNCNYFSESIFPLSFEVINSARAHIVIIVGNACSMDIIILPSTFSLLPRFHAIS